jgi:hypothetical protein
MSLENAQSMVDLLLADQSSMIDQYGSVTNREEILEKTVELGKENSLVFTPEAFEEALSTKGYVLDENGSLVSASYVGEDGELDEKALEAVAGGSWCIIRIGSVKGGGTW